LGKNAHCATNAFKGDYICIDYSIGVDLSALHKKERGDFDARLRRIIKECHPTYNNHEVGARCGYFWNFINGISDGDIVLSPDGGGNIRFGFISNIYYYESDSQHHAPDGLHPHRRPVSWDKRIIKENLFPPRLRNFITTPPAFKEFPVGFHAEIRRLLDRDLDPSALTKSGIEGTINERWHKDRERDPSLIKAAKDRALKKGNGRIHCECCRFDFLEAYGEIGYGFIEAHHAEKPVRAYHPAGEQSTIDDFALVCANCHRMLHRSPRWLKRHELGVLIPEKFKR